MKVVKLLDGVTVDGVTVEEPSTKLPQHPEMPYNMEVKGTSV
jgi:hypothetical protein